MSGAGNTIGARLETLFCFLSISTFLGAYATIPLRLQGGTSLEGGESNPFNAASMALVLVAMIALIAANWRDFLAVARLGGPVNILMALAMLSTLWSFDPSVTLRRSFSMLQMVVFGYYMVARFPMERVLRILAAVFAGALIVSAIIALAAPDVGVMHTADVDGAWCGAFEHKSSLGVACTLGALCFGWQWVHEPQRRTLYTVGIVLCLFLAIMSRSKIAQLTIVALIPIAAYLRLIRLPGLRRLWAVYIAVAVALAGAAFLFFFFADLTGAVGKDATLTGRIPIWTRLLQFALTRPLGGYGYAAFFVLGNPDVEDVWRQGGWVMWDAHNTIIGILLDFGIPGLVLSAWILFALIRNSLAALSADSASWGAFVVIYIVSNAPISFVEMILYRGDIHSMLVTMFYVALQKQIARTDVARAGVARLSAARTRNAAHQFQR